MSVQYAGQSAATGSPHAYAARLAEQACATNNPLHVRTAMQQIAGMLEATRDPQQTQFAAQLRSAVGTLDDFRVVQYCRQVAAHFAQQSTQPAAAPAKRRPTIVKKRKDSLPMVLAVLGVVAMLGLGYAAYYFLVQNPRQPETAKGKGPRIIVRNSTDGGTAGGDAGSSASVDGGSAATGSDASMVEADPTDAATNDNDPFSIADIGMTNNADAAVAKVCRKINESVALGDRTTAVVWLFDQTPSAESRRNEVVESLKKFYPLLVPEKDPKPTADGEPRLLTLVGGYAGEAILDGEPTGDVDKAVAGMASIKGDGAGNSEKPFTAIELAANKIAPLGGPPRLCRLAIVLVTDDEPGDDQAERDRVTELVLKHRIPVYIIGTGVQLNGGGGMMAGPEGMQQTPGTDTRERESVQLDGPSGPSVTIGQQLPLGPYGLAALCKQTGGEYIAITSIGAATLPPQYYPKYKSEKDYQAEVAGNKALQALIAAAKLPRVKTLVAGGGSFAVDEAGTPTVAEIDQAQRPVALLLPQIIELHETLKKGEADRAKLTDPRQQAAFDCALGRAMAARVRAEGYNTLLAAFKAGRKGSKPETRLWSLVPGEGIEKNSVLDNMSKKAREYLEGVRDKHPNTPWAEAAIQELNTPIGWMWQEN